MANHVLLDNITHGELKVITRRDAALGDALHCTPLFLSEFRQAQNCYPIFFRKDPQSQRYEPVALLGLEEKENLYLTPSGWDATYLPLSIARQPFLIGFTQSFDNGVPVKNPVVHVDIEHPRVSFTQGVPVFSPQGGNSPYLEQITRVLMAIHQGHQALPAFSAALTELDLLEPFTLDIQLQHGKTCQLGGLYTLHEERFKTLPTDAVQKLWQSGYLEDLYMVLASLSNITALVKRKNTTQQEL
jgi:hypothetical protein